MKAHPHLFSYCDQHVSQLCSGPTTTCDHVSCICPNICTSSCLSHTICLWHVLLTTEQSLRRLSAARGQLSDVLHS